MFARALPIISGVFLVFFILACNGRNQYPENPPASSSIRELPDTSYLFVTDFNNRSKYFSEYDSLPDSLVRLYTRRTHNSRKNTPSNLNNYGSSYHAYSAEPYYLGDSTWGKLILFKPESHGFSSLQMYLTNNKGIIKDVIEPAYIFSDAGINGSGESMLISQGQEKIIYSKLYWERAIQKFAELDTIVGYQIRQGRKYALPVSEEKRKELRQLFRRYTRAFTNKF